MCIRDSSSSDNRLTVYGTDGYMYAETDGFWGACTRETGGRLVTGKDPGWRNHQQVPIQTPYYTQFALSLIHISRSVWSRPVRPPSC